MKTSEGFTLVELLVSILIISLLMIFGVASYNNFARSQTLRNAALELKTNLRFAQNQALSGVKDSNCVGNELVGWYLSFNAGWGTYPLIIKCKVISPPRIRGVYSLPAGITIDAISSGRDILFKPFSGVVFTSDGNNDSPTPLPGVNSVTVDLVYGESKYRVTVTEQGEIYETKL